MSHASLIRHAALVLAFTLCSSAGASDLHFVIPAGAGGGLDGTARTMGADLMRLNLAHSVSYENVTGGGGGRAMSVFVRMAPTRTDALLVNSTPLVIRSLQGLFPHGHEDLTPIAALIADYGALVVRADSAWQTWADVVAPTPDNLRQLNFGGGSVRGSLDHVVLAMAAASAGVSPRAVRYLPYDGGGKAAIALLGHEIDVLSSGVGETMSFVRSGDFRVLAVSAPSRLPALPDVPTFEELGFDVVMANWRGVFAPPGLAADAIAAHIERLTVLTRSAQWTETLERHGWASQFIAGPAFAQFLDAESARLEVALRDLGFLN